MSSNLIIYTDGACRGNPGPAAIGAILDDESGHRVSEISRSIGTSTNNRAEYMALIAALEEASRMGAERVEIRMDSELVVRQLLGIYRVKNAQLKPLLKQAKTLLAGFHSYNIRHVPRNENRAADALANRALDKLM